MPREYTRVYDCARSYRFDPETLRLLRLIAERDGPGPNESLTLRRLIRQEAERLLIAIAMVKPAQHVEKNSD